MSAQDQHSRALWPDHHHQSRRLEDEAALYRAPDTPWLHHVNEPGDGPER